jgi:hypothetical protein
MSSLLPLSIQVATNRRHADFGRASKEGGAPGCPPAHQSPDGGRRAADGEIETATIGFNLEEEVSSWPLQLGRRIPTIFWSGLFSYREASLIRHVKHQAGRTERCAQPEVVFRLNAIRAVKGIRVPITRPFEHFLTARREVNGLSDLIIKRDRLESFLARPPSSRKHRPTRTHRFYSFAAAVRPCLGRARVVKKVL